MKRVLAMTWAALTWKKMLLTQIFGATAIIVESLEGNLFGTWMGHPSMHFASMMLYVLLTLPLALAADAAVECGSKPRYVYPLAIALTLPIAGVCTGFVQWIYILIYGLPRSTPNHASRAFIETTFHIYIYAAFVMLVYMNRRTADRLLDNFRKAELRRVQLENQLVDSRLATAEAQIDPAMLFSELGEIKRGLEASDPAAEPRLNALIQSLRLALARTVAVNVSDASSP